MALEDIVNLTITAASKTPSRPGFGTPLFACYKVPASFTNRVREYGSLTELTDAGFLVTDPAYLMASKAFSQNPRPRKVKIGRRALPFTKIFRLKVTTNAVGEVYKVTAGTQAEVSYTVPAGPPTTTAIATSIAALITGGGWTATTSTDTIILTAAAGALPNVKNWTTNFQASDTTADPGIATDLAAIIAESSDWYGLCLDSSSKLESVAAAAWVEANKKVAAWDTSDYEVTNAGSTTDIAYVLKAASYMRSMPILNQNELLSYSGPALLGNRFPFSPGSDTWAFKTLAGVTVSVLTDGQISAALAKNCTVYTTVAGIPITQFGRSSGGEWMDVTRFIDWLGSEIKIRVFSLFANNQKVPFTDLGVDMVISVITGALQDGITVGGLAATPAPTVTAPLVADVSTIDRGNRNLPGIEFKARLAGAIHAVVINGSLAI